MSQPYVPPRPVTGIALLYFYYRSIESGLLSKYLYSEYSDYAVGWMTGESGNLHIFFQNIHSCDKYLRSYL
jgi:hypothetical protein